MIKSGRGRLPRGGRREILDVLRRRDGALLLHQRLHGGPDLHAALREAHPGAGLAGRAADRRRRRILADEAADRQRVGPAEEPHQARVHASGHQGPEEADGLP